MRAVAVVAMGAVSGLGLGEEAYRVGTPGESARTVLQHDATLAAAGLRRPRAARAPLATQDQVDRASQLLLYALDDAVAQLELCCPHWRDLRIGLCLGTSSGGMQSAELFFQHGLAEAAAEAMPVSKIAEAAYFAPFLAAKARLPGKLCRSSQVVAACASSTLAIGLGMRWLDGGACDLVFAGGYDAISLFVASGFEVLRATTATAPSPFRKQRRGMNLGEGAAVLVLQRASASSRAQFYLAGFGAACDAKHVTAPDREAGGLVRAGKRALREAGEPCIGLLSPHATATPYNDAAEAKAIGQLCPDQPVVHPFKAQIGHTLGAAGALELCAAADAMRRNIAPAAAGEGVLEENLAFRLLDTAEADDSNAILKLSAGFGGVTAALVATRDNRLRRRLPQRLVALSQWRCSTEWSEHELKRQAGFSTAAFSKLDRLSKLGLSATLELDTATISSEAGVVVGHSLATLQTNAAFFASMQRRGTARAEPRLFPATSPNLVAGQVAIALGLRGPNFALNASLDGAWEALAAAVELIAAGDADEMLVIAVDDCGVHIDRWLQAVCPERSYASGAVALHLRVAKPGDEPLKLEQLPQSPEHEAIGYLALQAWLQKRRV